MTSSIIKISDLLTAFFSKEKIEWLGKEHKFVQRSSAKLTSYHFLLMNIFDRTSGAEKSLRDSCVWLEEHLGISMSKQSLDERYNTYAVRFMKSCFETLLQQVNASELKKVALKTFSVVQLTDATSFKIDDSLSSFYKGYKGRGGQGMIKLHLNYDLLNGEITDVCLGDGGQHDNSYTFGASETIQEGGLYLRDLGYYDFDYFDALAQAGSYFLSRAKTNATFYTKTADDSYERLVLEDMCVDSDELKDLPLVYLGCGKKKLAVRLVMERVPEEVRQQRLAKLAQYAQKQKDKTVSSKRKAMSQYNLFITNASQAAIGGTQIRAVYSLRWQIELMFKVWKSHYDIDKTHKMSIFRFECHIYAQLIALLLDHSLKKGMAPIFQDDLDAELSPIKASKLIKKTL